MQVWHSDTADTFVHEDDGVAISEYGTGYDLLTPWHEPRSGEVWVNVYVNRAEYTDSTREVVHSSKLMAQTAADFTMSGVEKPRECIARIRVPWKEGQFDE